MAIQSLFGPTPAQIQEMRRQQEEQEILSSGGQFGVFAPLYQAGLRAQQRGREALAPILGTQDPMLQQATAVQSVLSKYQGQDLSSPEVLTKIGQELLPVAPDAGMRAMAFARELAPKGGKITLGAELLNQIAPEDRSRVVQSYQATGKLPEDTQWTVEKDKSKELSPTDQAKQIIFSLSEKENRTPDEERQLRSAQNVLASTRPTNIFEITTGGKNVLDVDKKQAEKYLAVQDSALSSLSVLTRMKDISRQGIVQGTLAEERTSFLNALDSIGLSTAGARKVLGNTELFQKETEALVQQILKIYGYNPSNVDVQRAVKSVPSIINSKGGLQQLLNSLVKVKEAELAESTRALDFYRKNDGSFKDFKPRIPVVAPKRGIQDLSDEQLQEILRRK